MDALGAVVDWLESFSPPLSGLNWSRRRPHNEPRRGQRGDGHRPSPQPPSRLHDPHLHRDEPHGRRDSLPRRRLRLLQTREHRPQARRLDSPWLHSGRTARRSLLPHHTRIQLGRSLRPNAHGLRRGDVEGGSEEGEAP